MQVYLQIPRWWYEISQHHYDPIRSSLLMALSLILPLPLYALIGCVGIKSTTWAHVRRRSAPSQASRAAPRLLYLARQSHGQLLRCVGQDRETR